jgi:hypothetical protein
MYPGYAHAAGAGQCGFFLEAAERDHILISGIVHWPEVAAPAAV